jgi:transcriptional regulator with XRE-family HTH domain
MQGSLAESLRLLRARKGLSLLAASEQLGVDRHTLRDLELGQGRTPRYPTLAKIAKGYGVPVEELLEEPVPLAEAPGKAGQTEVEETDTPGVAPDVLSHFVKFTTQLADVLEAEIERVEQDRTFPYFAWDYRTEATISHLTQQLGEDGILAYVAEVREGRRMAQNEGRRLAVALASNLSRLRHLAERAHVIAQILHVDSHVEGRRDAARPLAHVLEEWERASAPSEARHD